MSGISRSSEEAIETRDFILRDYLPHYKNVFMEVSENTIETGDLVLFKMLSSSNAMLCFKHAVVYCGDGEVIHFQKIKGSSTGRIIKEGFRLMRQQRGKGKVLRKKEGVNLETFTEKVKQLMNSTAEYSALNNNCINFALYLLDLGNFSFQPPKSHEEELESLTMSGLIRRLEEAIETTDFILCDYLPHYNNVFIEVSENTIETGDIVLFKMLSSSNAMLCFKHAVVYCGDGEVIHFQKIEGSSTGQISKEEFQIMRQQRGKGKVLRKKDGVNLETFTEKVKQLMNSTAEYDFLKNNSINFAFYLLDLGSFSFQSPKSHEEELESLTAQRNMIV